MSGIRWGNRTGPTVALCIAALFVVAGCSTSGSSAGSGSSATGSAHEVPAVVSQTVAKYSAQPTFTAPGDPIDITSLRGKSMYVIPQVDNPFHQSIIDAMKAVATKVGIKLTVYPTQGNPSQWVQGMNAAIGGGANIINLLGVDPKLLQPQLAEAKANNIAVVSTHIYDDSAPQAPNCDGCSAGVTALVPGPFYLAGQVAANWMIADSKASGHILIVGAPDVPVSPGTVSIMQKEFTSNCPACVVSVIQVPAADWNTKVQGSVSSALNRDPSINYVYPLYDAMVSGVVSAVRAAGKANSVKVASYNGSTYVLKYIQDKDVAAMDIGEDSIGIAYASMDQSFRILLGVPPVEARTPIRIWDATNVTEAGVPPVPGKGYGDAFQTGYEKLWGLR